MAEQPAEEEVDLKKVNKLLLSFGEIKREAFLVFNMNSERNNIIHQELFNKALKHYPDLLAKNRVHPQDIRDETERAQEEMSATREQRIHFSRVVIRCLSTIE